MSKNVLGKYQTSSKQIPEKYQKSIGKYKKSIKKVPEKYRKSNQKCTGKVLEKYVCVCKPIAYFDEILNFRSRIQSANIPGPYVLNIFLLRVTFHKFLDIVFCEFSQSPELIQRVGGSLVRSWHEHLTHLCQLRLPHLTHHCQ